MSNRKPRDPSSSSGFAVASRKAAVKRPGRIRRSFERVVLGVLMTVLAYVVERRLRKALRPSEPLEEGERTVRIG